MKNATKHATDNMNVVTLTPTEARDFLVGTYLAGVYHRTPLLRGSPGIGKSSIVKAAAAEIRKTRPNFHYVEINPTMPADEVGGIPEFVRVEGQATRTDYALPSWFPTAAEDPEWEGIINLDDALQGDRLMQQTLANLILARNLRGHALPKGAMIVATGNRMEDKAGVTRTLTHFADRMCWINVEADPVSWIDNFAIPRNLRQEVISYIMFDKSKLDMFDPNGDKCPTPRTWEAVSNWLTYLDTLSNPNMDKIRNKMAQSILGGELGVGEGGRFWAYCQMYSKLPDVDDLLKNPATASIDYELDVQYALAVAIANRMNPNNFSSALEYIDRIGPDLTTLAVKIGTVNKPEIRKCPAWAKWAIKNTDVMCR